MKGEQYTLRRGRREAEHAERSINQQSAVASRITTTTTAEMVNESRHSDSETEENGSEGTRTFSQLSRTLFNNRLPKFLVDYPTRTHLMFASFFISILSLSCASIYIQTLVLMTEQASRQKQRNE